MPRKGHKNRLCKRGHDMHFCGKEIQGRWRCATCYILASRVRVLRAYDLTLEDFDTMLVQQNALCAVCQKSNTSTKRFHIDHCHSTGKVRGLLCKHCNQGLGHFRDNIEILQKAIVYLKGE